MVLAGLLTLGPAGCARADNGDPGVVDGVLGWFLGFTSSDEGAWYLDRNLSGFRAYPLIERALRRMEAGEYEQARGLMNRALRIAPRSAKAWTVSGDLEMRRGHINTALEHLEYALYLDPDLPQARLYRAFVMIELGRYDDARADLEFAVNSGRLSDEHMNIAQNGLHTVRGGVGTADFSADLQAANDMLDSGNAGRALSMYLEIGGSNAYPDQRAAALRVAAAIYTQAQYPDEAVETLLRLLDVTELSPDDRRLLIVNARAAGRNDVLEAQLRWLTREGEPDERARAGLELAQLLSERGEIEDARDVLQEVINDPALIDAERILLQAQLDGLEVRRLRPSQTDAAPVAPTPATPARREPTVDDLIERFNADPVTPAAGDRAYDLAAEGNCAAAGPLFIEGFNQTGEGALLIARADCFNNQGNTAAALAAFEDARAQSANLPVAQEAYLLTSLGYLYEAQGRYAEAAEAWGAALNLQNTPDIKLAYARNLVATGQMDAAADLLAELSPGTLSIPERASFFDLRASVRGAQNPQAAIEDLRAAVAAEESADRHLRLAVALQAQNNHNEALTHMRRAYELDPDNPELAISLAYALGNVGREAESIPLFQEGIRADEAEYYATREDLAYAQLRTRRFNDAARSFRGVVDSAPRYPQATRQERDDLDERMYRVRSEIRELERTWYLYGSASYRSSDINSSGLPGNDRNQSQIGVEAGWYPLRGRVSWGRGFSVFARAYESFEPDSFELREESAQGGIGLRLQPFESFQFVLTAERLIAIGELARDAWQFTAAHGWGVGGDWRPADDNWWVANTYLEGAWIPEEPSFMSVNGEATAGRAFRIAPHLAVIPHGVVSARYSEDEFVQNFLGELGLGVSLRYWFDDSRYHAPRGTAELQLQYRWYAYEDTAIPLTDDGTFLGRLVISR